MGGRALQSELVVVGPVSLIIDPESGSWAWTVGELKEKGVI
jgi:hypothetical protein